MKDKGREREEGIIGKNDRGRTEKNERERNGGRNRS